MSRVTKSDGWEAYSVRAGEQDMEWATIIIRGWQAPGNDGRPREIGEILVHSSYGSWAYQWGHLGQPFKEWLATMNDKHYVAGKFLGTNAYVFDGEKTLQGLRESILEARRAGDLPKSDARTIWDYVEENSVEMESSEDRFVDKMYDCMREADWQDLDRQSKYPATAPSRDARHFLEEPWERIQRGLNRQFATFWDLMIPPFQATLRQELEASKAAA